MRSSKSRSRGSKNRNRPSGANIVNRVFDSSGPDGKVRGTPQQIIDKYNQLHRDAQLSDDRVAVEAFAQHAEHYTRMLAEAMREQDAKREEQERINRERQADRDRERNERQQSHDTQQATQTAAATNDPAQQDQPELRAAPAPTPKPAPAAEVIAPVDAGDSGLVETPEAQPKPRRPRKPRTRTSPAPKPDAPSGGDNTPEAAE